MTRARDARAALKDTQKHGLGCASQLTVFCDAQTSTQKTLGCEGILQIGPHWIELAARVKTLSRPENEKLVKTPRNAYARSGAECEPDGRQKTCVCHAVLSTTGDYRDR
jgi:hypothetical protein